MSTKNFTLPATQIKDPLNISQLRREIKEIKDVLSLLPIMISNEEPEGVVSAAPGTVLVNKNGDEASLYFKSSGSQSTGWDQVDFV